MNSVYRIVLADGQLNFRSGMKRLIAEMRDMQVVGEVGDGVELLECLEVQSPDMAIVDITMPRCKGITIAHEIHERHPRIKLLIHTMQKNTAYLFSAIASGVQGYLLKEDSDVELFKAIHAIRNGKTYITRKLAGELASEISCVLKGLARRPKERLSSREKEVLRLISEGKPNRVVAANLGISVRTVENHRARIMKKLNLCNTAELVRYAIQEGITALKL
jgi:DNA-binding NarL/FixJ family response regulator